MNSNQTTGHIKNVEGGQFLLNIRYQQNNSWQGSVQRLDTGEIINFRSALELMSLIESVVGQQTENKHEDHRLRRWEKPREVDKIDHKLMASGS